MKPSDDVPRPNTEELIRGRFVSKRGSIMRVRQIGFALVSGASIYYAMAACSAIGGGSSSSSGDTSAGAPESSGTEDDGSTGGGSLPGIVPSANADEWYSAGSRLKLRYLEGSDGSKQFFGWLDTGRGEECGFAKHADGMIRCLPTSVGSLFYFGSSGCDVLVASAPKGAPVPKYGVTYEASGGEHFFRVTGSHLGAVYSGSPAYCSDSSSRKTVYDFFDVGAEVPGTAFMDASLKTAL